ncbi:Ephrin type-A receptor 2 [Tulasnella sp. 408]|nr:Ephrin type-A receptor 2 [Tulasnella sp. 408]
MNGTSKTITTPDGCILDPAVVERSIQGTEHFTTPEDRLDLGGAKSLGKGGFGQVKAATLLPAAGSSGAPITVAVKILKADDWNVPPERVAYFIGYSRGKDDKKAYLVSPFIKNGNIQHFLSKNNLNVLVNDDLSALLCDFGLSVTMGDRKEELATAPNFKGSPQWCSPEALTENKKTFKGDIWSWGCLVLEIMTGKLPYDDIKPGGAMVLRIAGPVGKRRKPEPNPLPSLPSGLVNLLWRCWEFHAERRPDISTCVRINDSVRSHAKGIPEWDAMWLDEWIMQFIVPFEAAVQDCISSAGKSPTLARNLCCVTSLSRTELQQDLKEVDSLLNPRRSGKRLSRTTTDYLLLRQRIIRSELRKVEWSTRSISKRRQDPVSRILYIFSLLHGPLSCTRGQIGEHFRELYGHLNSVIAPLDRNNHRLASGLATFGLLVKHYPNHWHDPEVVNHAINVYYAHHHRNGNYRLCLDVALQAAQQYRRFAETDQTFLPCLAGALDKAASCAEFLHEHETARPLLQEAVSVYRKLVGVDPKGKQVQIHEFKIHLAGTLVRFSRVVCRLGQDLAAHWQKDALDSLREAIKIYTSARSFGQSGPAKYDEELEDALWDLLVMVRRKNDKVEVAEVETRLRRLQNREQIE